MGRGLQPQGGMEHLQGSPGPHKGSQAEEQRAAQQGALTEWLGWGVSSEARKRVEMGLEESWMPRRSLVFPQLMVAVVSGSQTA